MAELIEIFKPEHPIKYSVELPASKSISNRFVILEALSNKTIKVRGHSDAEDTLRLQNIINELPGRADAGAGGTTFRFALAYLASLDGYSGMITGTDRLKERPVAPLVDALRSLGADIQYAEKPGFPPLKVKGKKLTGGSVSLSGEISSQFLSSIILIAPTMESGLEIDTGGKITSRPYLDMTLALVNQSGFSASEKDGIIRVQPGKWNSGLYVVEKDWSSASYWYSIALLANHSDIFLPGLSLDSLQGDSKTAYLFDQLGVETKSEVNGIRLKPTGKSCSYFEFDFTDQPDLAQTIAVSVAGMGISAKLSGLKSLRRKETDRISALRNELIKFGVKTEEPEEGCLTIDPAGVEFRKEIIVDTYEDHRMAMAFAPMCLKVYKLAIRNPDVVNKSYPSYWSELRKAGFGLHAQTH